MPNPSRNKGSKDIVEWRVIPSFPDYEVSEFGSVRRLNKARTRYAGHLLKGAQCAQIGAFGDSYIRYKLSKNKQKITISAHRLVADAFLSPRPSSLHQVLHKDGTRSNNHYSNLAWGTHQENMRDTANHGIRKGSKNGRAKLSEEQVREIRLTFVPGYGQMKKLRERYDMSDSALRSILKGEHWDHA